MLINGYINIVIVIIIIIVIFIVVVIVRIILTNPKPLFNIYAFTFILGTKDWNNKVVLKYQIPF